MMRLRSIAAALCLGLLAGHAYATDEIRIFAAASIAPSIEKAGALYKADHDVAIVITPAASGALAKQIEAGAPADVFVSADVKWMKYGVDKGFVTEGTVGNLAGNTLVLVAAKDAATPIDLADAKALPAALGEERLAVGEAKSVPAGAYAEAALKKLGLYDALAPHFAPAENVRVALQLVARGEARFGIVYGTDAKAEPGVAVVATFPADSHEPIVYPIGLTKTAAPAAAAFVDYLKTDAAWATFATEGFAKP
jgi:molybdate transport system substrate-binding protein